jgi:hypothetical protein
MFTTVDMITVVNILSTAVDGETPTTLVSNLEYVTDTRVTTDNE